MDGYYLKQVRWEGKSCGPSHLNVNPLPKAPKDTECYKTCRINARAGMYIALIDTYMNVGLCRYHTRKRKYLPSKRLESNSGCGQKGGVHTSRKAIFPHSSPHYRNSQPHLQFLGHLVGGYDSSSPSEFWLAVHLFCVFVGSN